MFINFCQSGAQYVQYDVHGADGRKDTSLAVIVPSDTHCRCLQ